MPLSRSWPEMGGPPFNLPGLQQFSDRDGLGIGTATIVVQEDGTFRWSRLVRKDRAFIAFVSYNDTYSNTVVWEQVR